MPTEQLLSSTTTSASQIRINRLRQSKQQISANKNDTKDQQQQQQQNPAAANLLQKRNQLNERQMKRSTEGISTNTTAEEQQERPSRDRKQETVRRYTSQKQQDAQNRSPRYADNEDNDDDTLVSVRRIVAKKSSPDHLYQTSITLPATNKQKPQQPYHSNYNSLSDNMHSLRQTTNVQRTKQSSKQQQHSQKQSHWFDEEKTDKLKIAGSGSFLTATSSDFGDEGDKETNQLIAGLDRPSFNKSVDANDYTPSPLNDQYATRNNARSLRRFYDDDDRTFDYGDRDDADDDNFSAESGSYAARRFKEAVRRKMLAAEMDSPSKAEKAKAAKESPFINKEDAEHFRKKIDSMDSPALRIAAGVAGAATVGVMVGPVGLLVGVAAVSVGFSLSQIPEEERGKMRSKAAASMLQCQEKACDAAESLGSTCASHYHESGVAEHIPSQVVDHLPQCLSTADGTVLDDDGVVAPLTAGTVLANGKTNSIVADNTNPEINSGATVGGRGKKVSGTAKAISGDPRVPSPTRADRPHPRSKRNKKVACLRNARILPAGQIYGLDPVAQPKAWLDVVANANTSFDEKNEAMEEILILAKDKRRARILLEEGILDYIIWVLGRYLEKIRNTSEEWKHQDVTPNERVAAKQAAVCCLTLGKAHCAAIHTEGDLQLMSLYERGIVPEERQVAQMLLEVPHHVRITNTPDPTIVDPSKEVFAYRELDLAQAEELAKSVMLVADGRI
eukprot:scaffold328_cov130-Cylindrotheca_fusiformis.AAC.15